MAYHATQTRLWARTQPARRPPTFRWLQALGFIWLLDGLLQLQPVMFTSYLGSGVIQSAAQGQPRPLAAVLQPLATLTAQHGVLANCTIIAAQVTIALAFITGWQLHRAVPFSVVWSAGVWIVGEGLGMIATGQASLLTGAPGAVMLYALVAVLLDQRRGPALHRAAQRCLAVTWALGTLLQIQPYWWHTGAISRAIAANRDPGTLSGSLLDPSLSSIAATTSGIELPLNLAIVALGLTLAIGLWNASRAWTRVLLAASIMISVAAWFATQGLGLLFTGQSTDVNSAPLLILLALIAWPREQADTRLTTTRA